MTTTEQEFHLLSELIDMDDRHLAQRTALVIWYRDGTIRKHIFEHLVWLCNKSETRIEFHKKLPQAIDAMERALQVKAVLSPAEGHVPCGMPGKPVMKHVPLTAFDL